MMRFRAVAMAGLLASGCAFFTVSSKRLTVTSGAIELGCGEFARVEVAQSNTAVKVEGKLTVLKLDRSGATPPLTRGHYHVTPDGRGGVLSATKDGATEVVWIVSTCSAPPQVAFKTRDSLSLESLEGTHTAQAVDGNCTFRFQQVPAGSEGWSISEKKGHADWVPTRGMSYGEVKVTAGDRVAFCPTKPCETAGVARLICSE